MIRVRRFTVAALLIALVGCGATLQATMWQAGFAAKDMAESAYRVIVRAHVGGRISDEQFAQAQTAYDAWATLQSGFVHVMQSSQASRDEREQKVHAMVAASMTVARLAQAWGLLP